MPRPIQISDLDNVEFKITMVDTWDEWFRPQRKDFLEEIYPVFDFSLKDLINESIKTVYAALDTHPQSLVSKQLNKSVNDVLPTFISQINAHCPLDSIRSCMKLFTQNISDPTMLLLKPFDIRKGYTEIASKRGGKQNLDIDYEHFVNGFKELIFFVKFTKVGLLELFNEKGEPNAKNSEMRQIMAEIVHKFIREKINYCMISDFNTNILLRIPPHSKVDKDENNLPVLHFETMILDITDKELTVQSTFMGILYYLRYYIPDEKKNIKKDLFFIEDEVFKS